MRLRVVDLETTGMEPPAEIVEFEYSDRLLEAGGASMTPPAAWLYRPVNGIPLETMAVHHLTPADFRPEMASATLGYMRAAIAHDGAPMCSSRTIARSSGSSLVPT